MRVSHSDPNRDLISKSEQRLKKFMQKPLHERSYGGKCCPNHGKQCGELLEAIM